jgi:hypothetical protein
VEHFSSGRRAGVEAVGRLKEKSEIQRTPRPWMRLQSVIVNFHQSEGGSLFWSLSVACEKIGEPFVYLSQRRLMGLPEEKKADEQNEEDELGA